MFEEVVINPDYTLGVLSIEKLLHDHLGAVMGTPIDEDYLYECMYQAIAEIAQDVECGYNDDWAMNIFHIVFPSAGNTAGVTGSASSAIPMSEPLSKQ